ncbi:MAG: alpha/beta fold hydrolase [Candidatus Dormibacteraeota bacterium]|nr:alpha/beta fold hydrolase [Candidatus Dormibacteraeota bacterium]
MEDPAGRRPLRRDRAHRGIDSAVLWRLGALRYETEGDLAREAVHPQSFWDESRVQHPAGVVVAARWEHRHGTEFRLEASSEGPGGHPGASKVIATAHVTHGLPADAPMVLLVHGYAVPMPLLDALVARTLRARGAHTMRIDLPFHLRRRMPGHGSGDGFFSTDPARIRATIRQSVEDAAALVAWARANVTPTVAVMGVSLGGLVSTLLASQVALDSVMAVAPLCDPPLTFLEHMPRRLARRVGLNATNGGAWGSDRGEARAMLDAALAPLVPRNFVPRTDPANITLVRPELDIIVGPQPIADLAATWGAELWDYPYGHITVMNAPGVGARIRDRLLDPSRFRAGQPPLAAAG